MEAGSADPHVVGPHLRPCGCFESGCKKLQLEEEEEERLLL